jgi:hypothetical protein
VEGALFSPPSDAAVRSWCTETRGGACVHGGARGDGGAAGRRRCFTHPNTHTHSISMGGRYSQVLREDPRRAVAPEGMGGQLCVLCCNRSFADVSPHVPRRPPRSLPRRPPRGSDRGRRMPPVDCLPT